MPDLGLLGGDRMKFVKVDNQLFLSANLMIDAQHYEEGIAPVELVASN